MKTSKNTKKKFTKNSPSGHVEVKKSTKSLSKHPPIPSPSSKKEKAHKKQETKNAPKDEIHTTKEGKEVKNAKEGRENNKTPIEDSLPLSEKPLSKNPFVRFRQKLLIKNAKRQREKLLSEQKKEEKKEAQVQAAQLVKETKDAKVADKKQQNAKNSFIRPKKQKEEHHRLSRIQKKKNLASYLSKAGYPDTSPERLRKRVTFIAAIIISILWVVPFVLTILNSRELVSFAYYTLGLWTVIFAFVWLLLWGIVYFYLEMRIYSRKKELEEVLPDFLQLTSSNISAGMPIDRALWLAIRPTFGVLAKEIEDVAKATLSGEDLADSLRHLVSRYDSVLLQRSISILLEGLNSGGELADLLSKIALNIQEIKIMKKEMSANVTTYAIFISFSSVGIAPVLFALATQLIVIIIGITASLDVGSSSSAISISVSPNGSIVDDFKIYCYMMLSVTAGMSAAIISVIQRGNVRDGIRNIPVFIILSLTIYTITSAAFASLMGGMF